MDELNAMAPYPRREGLPSWRSMLYMPVNVERFVEKAHLLDIDAIQLDLEDSVAPSEKENARKLVPAAAAKAARGGADIIVRINQPIGLAVRDIDASVCQNVVALNLPKVLGADHVRLLSEHTAQAELRSGMEVGTTRFIVTIETAEAWFRLREICSADSRIVGVMLGGEDFALDTGMDASAEVMLGPKQQVVIAAAAAGIAPMGMLGSIAQFGDMDDFRAMVRRSKAFGFRGASCVHPSQAKILNEEFRPSAPDLQWARRTIETYQRARETAQGAVAQQGQMIDMPVVMKARSLIAWDERIEAQQRLRAQVVAA